MARRHVTSRKTKFLSARQNDNAYLESLVFAVFFAEVIIVARSQMTSESCFAALGGACVTRKWCEIGPLELVGSKQ